MDDAKSIFDDVPKGKLMQAIKANHETLRACPCHDFSPKTDDGRLHDRVQCKKCGGEMSGLDAWLWTSGFEAGRKSAEEDKR
jgi:hypothetical protein